MPCWCRRCRSLRPKRQPLGSQGVFSRFPLRPAGRAGRAVGWSQVPLPWPPGASLGERASETRTTTGEGEQRMHRAREVDLRISRIELS